MKTWIICISGFTQRRGISNGTVELWQLMREFSGPDCVVQLKLWDDDWEDFGAFVRNNSPRGVRILVCAYSWGAGHGMVRLAKALHGHCTIDVAVLSDPIYRSRLLSTRWLAMTPWPRITIPSNVEEVHWFRQAVDRPRAHDLREESVEATWIHEPIYLDLPHSRMDEATEYHDRCLVEAARLTRGIF